MNLDDHSLNPSPQTVIFQSLLSNCNKGQRTCQAFLNMTKRMCTWGSREGDTKHPKSLEGCIFYSPFKTRKLKSKTEGME